MSGCGSIDTSNIDWERVGDAIENFREECPVCKPTECPRCPECIETEKSDEPLTPISIEPEKQEKSNLYLNGSCKQPVKVTDQMRSDGLKCLGSHSPAFKGEARCLLPWQFGEDCKPYINYTNHHGVTMKACANSDYPDRLNLLNKKGKTIATLEYQSCVNWAPCPDGKCCRPQYRNPDFKWDDISKKVDTIEIVKDGVGKSCLKVK